MNFKKYLLLGGVALGMGITTSCVGDLDLEPNDPNQTSQALNTQFFLGALAKCYSGMAVSGQNGPGSSDISGLDNGTGCYTRALFMMNVFPTDEALWIWPDAGVVDLVTNTWDASNGNIYGTYSRLYTHISTCNDFLTMTANAEGSDIEQMRAEARALRAMSYYWVVDIFGNGSYVTEADEIGGSPRQATRKELFEFVESELCEVAGVSFDEAGYIQEGASMLPENNFYGRLSRDGALGLLSRLYLNAEVYTGTPQYRKCAQVSDYVISRHSGGFQGSGLAEDYLYLFCASNKEYQNGGEILWSIPYEKDNIQSYGGTTFLIAASIANELGMSQTNYGLSSAWKCMHARTQFANLFDDGDARDAMWVKGKVEYKDGTNDDGSDKMASADYTAENTEFSEWTNGYAVIKFTNLLKGDGQGDPKDTEGTFWDAASFADGYASAFADTDLPMVRLAEMYLNYTESYVLGGGSAADSEKARKYVNLVRARSDNPEWGSADLTADNILDERCRELYWELTRRSDLVRHHKFTGPNQALWSWKGNVAAGARIADRYDLMPIPTNTLAAQPNFKQNPGY